MRSILIVCHRYLGIALALPFLLWFVSGFVIIYTGGMPRLTEADRLTHLPALDFNQVAVAPADAGNRVSSNSLPRLTTVMGRPAYRFTGSDSAVIFADNGERLSSAMVSSRNIVAQFIGEPAAAISRLGTLEEVDQWTIGLRNQLPLEKFAVEDGRGSIVYVSAKDARVVLHTSTRDRFLAWVGAIPHWFYFLPLRQNTELWSKVVIWSASLGAVLAGMGLCLLAMKIRWRSFSAMFVLIPRKGLMGWHYVSGLIFGVFVLTWVFSGLLSMEPYRWTRQSGATFNFEQYAGDPAPIGEYSTLATLSSDIALSDVLKDTEIKEVQAKTYAGMAFFQWTVVNKDSTWHHSILRTKTTPPFELLERLDSATVISQVQKATSAQIISTELLTQYDNYYYSRASADGRQASLPVYKILLDDPVNTALYIDAENGEPVFRSHRWSRLERWLYSGLHSLDFGGLYRSRPWWDVLIWILLSGGLVVSFVGTLLGIRRLRRIS